MSWNDRDSSKWAIWHKSLNKSYWFKGNNGFRMFIISYAWKIRIKSINYWLSFSSAFIQSEKALIIESAKFTGYTFTCLQELLNFHFSFDFLHFLPAISVSELACFFPLFIPSWKPWQQTGAHLSPAFSRGPFFSAAGHFWPIPSEFGPVLLPAHNFAILWYFTFSNWDNLVSIWQPNSDL